MPSFNWDCRLSGTKSAILCYMLRTGLDNNLLNSDLFRYMTEDWIYLSKSGCNGTHTHIWCCLLDEWDDRVNVSAVCGHKIGWIFTAVSSHHIIVLQAPFFSSEPNRSSFNLGNSVVSIPSLRPQSGERQCRPPPHPLTSPYHQHQYSSSVDLCVMV